MSLYENGPQPFGGEPNEGVRDTSIAFSIGKAAVQREVPDVSVEGPLSEERIPHNPHIEMHVHPDSEVEIAHVDTQPGELPYVSPASNG